MFLIQKNFANVVKEDVGNILEHLY